MSCSTTWGAGCVCAVCGRRRNRIFFFSELGRLHRKYENCLAPAKSKWNAWQKYGSHRYRLQKVTFSIINVRFVYVRGTMRMCRTECHVDGCGCVARGQGSPLEHRSLQNPKKNHYKFQLRHIFRRPKTQMEMHMNQTKRNWIKSSRLGAGGRVNRKKRACVRHAHVV